MPKFILLLHEGPNAFPADISPDQIQAIIQRYVEWRQKVQQNGRKVEGHGKRSFRSNGRTKQPKDKPRTPAWQGPSPAAAWALGALDELPVAANSRKRSEA